MKIGGYSEKAKNKTIPCVQDDLPMFREQTRPGGVRLQGSYFAGKRLVSRPGKRTAALYICRFGKGG